jgi:hypothetical protein
MFIVYESSFFIGEEWVPQEEAEIGLLEALNNELVRDFWVCAHLKFLRNLFHATPSECRVVRMLGRLEPVCLSETVEEHMASLEEQLERRLFTRTMSRRSLSWCPPLLLFLLLLPLPLVSTLLLVVLSVPKKSCS